jgi:ketol-acid reductoisomerase
MVAFVRAGVELAFETMVDAGIKPESAYYESLHETPLIANTIARKKLFEMNRVISDTAEYGCYLFDQACKPLLGDFMKYKGITIKIGFASTNRTIEEAMQSLVQMKW